MKRYITVKEASELWGISERRISKLCKENRIEGVKKFANLWAIPENTNKPVDGRKKETSIIDKQLTKKNIKIERIWAMPNKNTFEIKPIKNLILEEMNDGIWIDPFANRNKLATVTNDLNLDYDTDYHMDALEFLKMFDDESVDGVLYDPPYSPRQVSECYNDVGFNVTWDMTKASFWGNHKREISRIVKNGGKVITFGWNSGGIGMKHGFSINRILMVPHGGWHNDTLCTVETKINNYKVSKKNIKEDMEQDNIMKKNLDSKDNLLISKFKNLPEGFWDFSDIDTSELTHGLHNYPATMIYPISRNIIKLVKDVMPIRTLFDPFVGSGTVLVEGVLSGISEMYGNDLNPLARFMTKVKTTCLEDEELLVAKQKLMNCIDLYYKKNECFINSVNEYMENVQQLDLTSRKGWGDQANIFLNKYCSEKQCDLKIPDFKNMGYWFKPSVILELAIIKECINKERNIDIRDFFLLALSETIRIVSNRRNGEFKMFRMKIEKVIEFNPSVRAEFCKILNRNIAKEIDYYNECSELQGKPCINIYNNNTTELKDMKDEVADLVITSPPYGDSKTTVAYGEYSRLSLQWLDLFDISDKEIMNIDKALMGGSKFRNGFEFNLKSDTLRKSLQRIAEIDIERAGDVYSFYNDLNESLGTIAKKTKIGAYQFWVVGNRIVKNVKLSTDVILSELALANGLEYIITLERVISNKVMPSANSPSNKVGKKSSTMLNEYIVVLKRSK